MMGLAKRSKCADEDSYMGDNGRTTKKSMEDKVFIRELMMGLHSKILCFSF